jgi:hypothetical protein
MKKIIISSSLAVSLMLFITGCAGPESTSAPQGGRYVRNPHLEKVWLGEGFDFNGYDTLYITSTKVDARVKPHDDEFKPMETAQGELQAELAYAITDKKLFKSVVTRESAIQPGAKVLRLENTIIEYTKGSSSARNWVGLYGGGQPVIKIDGRMMDGEKPVFTCEGRRSGVSAGSRVMGSSMTDEAIQFEDIKSLVKDLSDFMESTAKHTPIK